MNPVKTMLTIRFRADISPEQAATHWRTVHRDLVLETPGVIGYTQNRVVTSVTDAVPWDGLIELTFADRESFESALSSAHWAGVNADAENFVEPGSIEMAIVAEEKLR